MKNKTLFTLFFISFIISHSFAQSSFKWGARNNFHTEYDKDWSVSLGVNAIYDAGNNFSEVSVSKNFIFSLPFMVSAEFYYNNKFSAELKLTTNRYTEGIQVEFLTILKGYEASYFAADFAAKFYFRDLVKWYKFDPYVFGGLGYTVIGTYKGYTQPGVTLPDYLEVDGNGNVTVPTIGRMTLNTGAGFNYWFSENWGVNLNVVGKWGQATKEHPIGSNSINNQIQFTIGALYFFNLNRNYCKIR